jgi:hypothetical protein
MLNKFKKSMLLSENQMYLHDKKVEIPKLTPDRWKKLFDKVDLIPGLIVQVLLAPKDDYYQTVVSACQLALDEVSEIVALLSDLEVEYIQKNVGLNEIIEFLARTVQKNKLDDIAKNLKSLLPKKKTE